MAAELQSAATHCSGVGCRGLTFDCKGAGHAQWTALCSDSAPHQAAPSAAGTQRHLIQGLLVALAYVQPRFAALAARPDLKRSAAHKVSKLTPRLQQYPAELRQFDAELAKTKGDTARTSLKKQIDATTSKAAKDVSEALSLVRSRRAIDPHYAQKLRMQAQEQAQKERAAEQAQARRQAALLAEKKAEAARIAAQEAKRVADAQKMQAALAEAGRDRAAARQSLIEGNKRADAALLSAIKFLTQRNLTKSGRSRTEQIRAELEANKKELGKIFAEMQKPGGNDPVQVEHHAAQLKKKAASTLSRIKSESTELDRTIEDKHSVRH